jgi:hypothetical protein
MYYGMNKTYDKISKKPTNPHPPEKIPIWSDQGQSVKKFPTGVAHQMDSMQFFYDFPIIIAISLNIPEIWVITWLKESRYYATRLNSLNHDPSLVLFINPHILSIKSLNWWTQQNIK